MPDYPADMAGHPVHDPVEPVQDLRKVARLVRVPANMPAQVAHLDCSLAHLPVQARHLHCNPDRLPAQADR
jgi:hypothetical protein